MRKPDAARHIATTVMVVLALLTASAASSSGHIAPSAVGAGACANERVGNAKYGETYFRFELHGRVSCGKAHALIREYDHKVDMNGCAGLGTLCGYHMPEGWFCGLPGYANGPFDVGCLRGGTSVKALITSPPASYMGLMHLRMFRSPDRRTLCSANVEMICDVPVGDERASHSAILRADGHLTVCNEPPGESKSPANSESSQRCLGVTTDRAAVLSPGQRSELDGILCVATAESIRCTISSGATAGKGFRISSSEAVEVG
jgi:hypothetical protein